MKIKTINSINSYEFDDLVEKTYGRPYNFQQQDGCKSRGVESFTVPNEHPQDYENASIPELVNGRAIGVSFKTWLERDPNQPLKSKDAKSEDRGFSSNSLSLFWERSFYPHPDMVTQDLYEKGLLPAGEYQIVIDW